MTSLGGKVYHNSILFDGFAQKVVGPRFYTDLSRGVCSLQDSLEQEPELVPRFSTVVFRVLYQQTNKQTNSVTGTGTGTRTVPMKQTLRVSAFFFLRNANASGRKFASQNHEILCISQSQKVVFSDK